jgi:hypothetical protein
MHVVDFFFFFLVLIARYACVGYLLHYIYIFFPYIFREGYCH